MRLNRYCPCCQAPESVFSSDRYAFFEHEDECERTGYAWDDNWAEWVPEDSAFEWDGPSRIAV